MRKKKRNGKKKKKKRKKRTKRKKRKKRKRGLRDSIFAPPFPPQNPSKEGAKQQLSHPI